MKPNRQAEAHVRVHRFEPLGLGDSIIKHRPPSQSQTSHTRFDDWPRSTALRPTYDVREMPRRPPHRAAHWSLHTHAMQSDAPLLGRCRHLPRHLHHGAPPDPQRVCATAHPVRISARTREAHGHHSRMLTRLLARLTGREDTYNRPPRAPDTCTHAGDHGHGIATHKTGMVLVAPPGVPLRSPPQGCTHAGLITTQVRYVAADPRALSALEGRLDEMDGVPMRALGRLAVELISDPACAPFISRKATGSPFSPLLELGACCELRFGTDTGISLATACCWIAAT